jgi:hypothetical protein
MTSLSNEGGVRVGSRGMVKRGIGSGLRRTLDQPAFWYTSSEVIQQQLSSAYSGIDLSRRWRSRPVPFAARPTPHLQDAVNHIPSKSVVKHV